MHFSQSNSRLYTRSGTGTLPRTKLGAFLAHSDDLEFGCPHAVIESLKNPDRNLGVVIVNDGSGPPYGASYSKMSPQEIIDVRIEEQFAAARAGKYEFAAMLSHPSSQTRPILNTVPQINEKLVAEMIEIIETTQPEVLYTHNPWDMHPSHIAVLKHLLCALRHTKHKPQGLFGGEVWGPLDRVPAPYLQVWDCTEFEDLLEELLRYFVSQNVIKSYDRNVPARRRTLAKLYHPHNDTGCNSVHLGVDMRLILTGEMSLLEFYDHCEGLIAKDHRPLLASAPRSMAT